MDIEHVSELTTVADLIPLIGSCHRVSVVRQSHFVHTHLNVNVNEEASLFIKFHRKLISQ
jgi:hypothetical protein